MATYNLSQLIDKQLYAKANVNARSSPSSEGTLITTFKKGEYVGIVFSAVNGEGGQWLMIDRNIGGLNKTFFVKASVALDISKLNEQGAQTVKQEQAAKEEASKTTGDKLLSMAKKAGIFIGLGLGTLELIRILTKNKQTAK